LPFRLGGLATRIEVPGFFESVVLMVLTPV
jgi:hypothetical protein